MADEQIKESRGWLIDFLASVPILSWLVQAEKNEQDVVIEEETTVDTPLNTEDRKPEPEKTPEPVIEQEQVEQAPQDQLADRAETEAEARTRRREENKAFWSDVGSKLYAGAVAFGKKIKNFFKDVNNESSGQNTLIAAGPIEYRAGADLTSPSSDAATTSDKELKTAVEKLQALGKNLQLAEMSSDDASIQLAEVSGGIEADDINGVISLDTTPSERARNTS